MIQITNFTISVDRLTINVSAETTVGDIFTSVNLWTDETFKDYAQAIDFTSKLLQANNTEVFTITAEEVGVSKFSGIYFIELNSTSVTTPACAECNNALGVATALIDFKECSLNKVLALSVCDGLDQNNISNSPEYNDVINVNMLIDALCTSLEQGYYSEALDFMAALRVLCNETGCPTCKECTDCTDLPTLEITTGLDFGTLNNTLILV